ncbi:hypothetical protein [Halalkalibacter lacteus]
MAIQQSIAELSKVSKGRTTLVIAEQGKHEELIEAEGIYSSLNYTQFG